MIKPKKLKFYGLQLKKLQKKEKEEEFKHIYP